MGFFGRLANLSKGLWKVGAGDDDGGERGLREAALREELAKGPALGGAEREVLLAEARALRARGTANKGSGKKGEESREGPSSNSGEAPNSRDAEPPVPPAFNEDGTRKRTL